MRFSLLDERNGYTARRTVMLRAVESLYEAFARYPCRPDMPYCDCCHAQADIARLCSPALRDLTPDDLDDYSASAVLTWGDIDDFRHFLPRIFELMAIDGFNPLSGAEAIVSRLRHCERRTWPDQEQRALADYFRAFWRLMLASEPQDEHWPWDWSIDTLLCSIAGAEDDLSPYLDRWLLDPIPTARCQLAAFVGENADNIVEGELGNAFWSDRPRQSVQVLAWLPDQRVSAALDDALKGERNNECRNLMTRAFAVLSTRAEDATAP